MSTTLSCEVRIKEAKNVSSNLGGSLFVRIRLPRHKTESLNTRQIPSRNDPIWDETFSLECPQIDDTRITASDTLGFELRRRSAVPFSGSKLLGSAEIPLERILSSSMVDTWLSLNSRRGGAGEAVKLKVEISATCRAETKKRAREYGCACRDGRCDNSYGSACDDYDVFALQLVC